MDHPAANGSREAQQDEVHDHPGVPEAELGGAEIPFDAGLVEANVFIGELAELMGVRCPRLQAH